MTNWHSYQKMQGVVALMKIYGLSVVAENNDGNFVGRMILQYDHFDVIFSMEYETDHIMAWIDGPNKEPIFSGPKPAFITDYDTLVSFIHGQVMELFTVDSPNAVS